MPVRLPFHLWRAILKPVCKSHVAVRKIDRIWPSLRCNGVLLRKDETHDLAKFDVVEEEMYVDGLGLILSRSVWLVVNEIIHRDHLHVRIFDVDAAWTTQGHGDGSISREQSPPYALPQAFVCAAELRMFDTKCC